MNAGPYWGVGLFGKYTMTSGDKDTTIAEISLKIISKDLIVV